MNEHNNTNVKSIPQTEVRSPAVRTLIGPVVIIFLVWLLCDRRGDQAAPQATGESDRINRARMLLSDSRPMQHADPSKMVLHQGPLVADTDGDGFMDATAGDTPSLVAEREDNALLLQLNFDGLGSGRMSHWHTSKMFPSQAPGPGLEPNVVEHPPQLVWKVGRHLTRQAWSAFSEGLESSQVTCLGQNMALPHVLNFAVWGSFDIEFGLEVDVDRTVCSFQHLRFGQAFQNQKYNWCIGGSMCSGKGPGPTVLKCQCSSKGSSPGAVVAFEPGIGGTSVDTFKVSLVQQSQSDSQQFAHAAGGKRFSTYLNTAFPGYSVRDVKGTWWIDASHAGGCEMPVTSYSVPYAVALSGDSALGRLAFRSNLCGQVLSVNCGGTTVEAVVASSAPVAGGPGGIALGRTTWDLATGYIPPASSKIVTCSVALTDARAMEDASPRCFIRPSASSQRQDSTYLAKTSSTLGIFNTGGVLVMSATLDGHAGILDDQTGYFHFTNGHGFHDMADLVATLADGTRVTIPYTQCKAVKDVHIWA